MTEFMVISVQQGKTKKKEETLEGRYIWLGMYWIYDAYRTASVGLLGPKLEILNRDIKL